MLFKLSMNTEVFSETVCEVMLIKVLFLMDDKALSSELHTQVPFVQHNLESLPLLFTVITLS